MTLLDAHGRLVRYAVHIAQPIWEALPPAILARRPVRRFGIWIHKHYASRQDRLQTHTTRFLRNRPQLEVIAALLGRRMAGGELKVASIGCSTGAELYSALWLLRNALPGLRISGVGVDISADAVQVAQAGRYSRNAPALRAHDDFAGEPEIKGMQPHLLGEFFVEKDDAFIVHDWIREGTSWLVGDVRSEVESLGAHDVVIANNFLGPMDDADAEACLRNLVLLVKPKGYLVVEGVDLDLKCRVLGSLGLIPVAQALEAVYFADYWKMGWPWVRWAHEPIDKSRSDWRLRYSTIFEVPQAFEHHEAAPDKATPKSAPQTIAYRHPDGAVASHPAPQPTPADDRHHH